MVVEIPIIRECVLGLFCIDPQDEQDRIEAQICGQQGTFFSQGEFIRLDVADKTVDCLAEELRNQVSAFGFSGTTIVSFKVAVFCDLRRTVDGDSVKVVREFYKNFKTSFPNYKATSIDYFAYIGRTNRSYAQEAFRAVSQNIGKLQTMLNNQRLLLVADLDDQNGNCWRPVFALLDLLRRKDSTPPLSNIDLNYRVGSFQFAEYDGKKRRAYENQRQEHSAVNPKSSYSFGDAKERCKKTWESIEDKIRKQLVPDGKLQPLHPGVSLKTGILNCISRHRALQPNGGFDNAKRETDFAINKTTQKMEHLIMTCCNYTREQADKLILELAKDVSLETLQSGDFDQFLSKEAKVSGDCENNLKWEKRLEKSTKNIQDYMENAFEKALSVSKGAFFKTIYESYTGFCHERNVDESRASPVQNHTESIPAFLKEPITLSEFCQQTIAHGENMPTLVKAPCNNGNSGKVCICYGDHYWSEPMIINALGNCRSADRVARTDFYIVPNCDEALRERIIAIDVNVYDYCYTNDQEKT